MSLSYCLKSIVDIQACNTKCLKVFAKCRRSNKSPFKWMLCWPFWNFSAFTNTGRSYAEDQPVSLYMVTACTTTMHDRICLASCRHPSSLATWPASAMHSSWCSGWWASVPPCSLSATYTNPSSVSKLCWKMKSSRVVPVFGATEKSQI